MFRTLSRRLAAKTTIRNVRQVKQPDGTTNDIRLLRPSVLSQRLNRLCNNGEFNTAIDTLKNSPLDAQNVVVWNTLITRVMAQGSFKTGYHLYADMKRRGITPSIRTYATILAAYARVPSVAWPHHTAQLNHAHAIYTAYLDAIGRLTSTPEAIKALSPADKTAVTNTTNMYLKVLANAGWYRKMFDVVYDMPRDGLGSADVVTWTIVFQAIAERQTLDDKPSFPTKGKEKQTDLDLSEVNIDLGLPSSKRTPPTLKQIQQNNASDAQLLYRHMLSTPSTHWAPDPQLISSIVRALSKGRMRDQELAFEVVREYVGLSRAGEVGLGAGLKGIREQRERELQKEMDRMSEWERKGRKGKEREKESRGGWKVELTPQLLTSLLDFTLHTKNYETCVGWVREVMEQPRVFKISYMKRSGKDKNVQGRVDEVKSVPDVGHVDMMLKALASLPPSPSPSSTSSSSTSQAPSSTSLSTQASAVTHQALQALRWLRAQSALHPRCITLKPVWSTFESVRAVCERWGDAEGVKEVDKIEKHVIRERKEREVRGRGRDDKQSVRPREKSEQWKGRGDEKRPRSREGRERRETKGRTRENAMSVQ